MADPVKSKGTSLSVGISGAAAAIAALTDIELPTQEMESTPVDTLDNATAGIPYMPTGRSEGGSFSFSFVLDPAVHGSFLTLLENPDGDMLAVSITFADTGTTTWSGDAAGFSFGGTVALADALRGKGSIKVSKLLTAA